MQIELNGPVTITLKPNTMAAVLDCLAKVLPYNLGKEIIEGEIFPQLMKKETPAEEKEGGGGGQ